MSAKDLYIQNITVSKHDNHSSSFQVKFPNIFMNYLLGPMGVEDKKYIDWSHYEFTLWQTKLNFVVFCASSACGVSIENMNAKKPIIRSIYRFHVYIRRLKKKDLKFHYHLKIVLINIIIDITMKGLLRFIVSVMI